jgi:hypothetical protein
MEPRLAHPLVILLAALRVARGPGGSVSRAFGGPAKLEQLKALKSSYERRDFVMKAGWATIPTAKEPNRDVAEGCAEVIAKAVGP